MLRGGVASGRRREDRRCNGQNPDQNLRGVHVSAAAGGDGNWIDSRSGVGGDLEREHVRNGRVKGQGSRGWVTVMEAGALAVSVTVPLNPLMGESARVLVPDPEGEIWTSEFRALREKSDWAMVTFTTLEAAAL